MAASHDRSLSAPARRSPAGAAGAPASVATESRRSVAWQDPYGRISVKPSTITSSCLRYQMSSRCHIVIHKGMAAECRSCGARGYTGRAASLLWAGAGTHQVFPQFGEGDSGCGSSFRRWLAADVRMHRLETGPVCGFQLDQGGRHCTEPERFMIRNDTGIRSHAGVRLSSMPTASGTGQRLENGEVGLEAGDARGERVMLIEPLAQPGVERRQRAAQFIPSGAIRLAGLARNKNRAGVIVATDLRNEAFALGCQGSTRCRSLSGTRGVPTGAGFRPQHAEASSNSCGGSTKYQPQQFSHFASTGHPTRPSGCHTLLSETAGGPQSRFHTGPWDVLNATTRRQVLQLRGPLLKAAPKQRIRSLWDL